MNQRLLFECLCLKLDRQRVPFNMELFYWWVCGWLIRCFSLIPYFLGGFYLENLLSSSICISLVFSLDFSNCFIEIFCLIWSLLPNLISILLFQVYSVKLFLYKCLQSVKCFGIWFSLNIFILVYWHRTFWNFWDLFDKSWKNFIAMFWLTGRWIPSGLSYLSTT